MIYGGNLNNDLASLMRRFWSKKQNCRLREPEKESEEKTGVERCTKWLICGGKLSFTGMSSCFPGCLQTHMLNVDLMLCIQKLWQFSRMQMQRKRPLSNDLMFSKDTELQLTVGGVNCTLLQHLFFKNSPFVVTNKPPCSMLWYKTSVYLGLHKLSLCTLLHINYSSALTGKTLAHFYPKT